MAIQYYQILMMAKMSKTEISAQKQHAVAATTT